MGVMRTAVIGICVAALLAGCGAGAAGRTAQATAMATATATAGWTTYRDPVRAFSVRFPSGWHRAARSQTPAVTDPVELLLLATFRLPRPVATRCAHVPEAAGRAMGDDDVLLEVSERRHPRGFPARSRPLRLGAPERTDFEDCTGRHDVEQHWLEVADGGRGFYVFVAFGRAVPATRRAAVQRVLDSLRFRPAAFDSLAVRG
jgi:hypothetical protein